MSLVFKGGTALRLAFGSPRFSDDLDLAALRQLRASSVFGWAKRTAKTWGIEITDQAEKRNTILVEFRIRDGAVGLPFKQKIEISTRKPLLKEGVVRAEAAL
jgi:predicted nucleotidyltransferase component of viral defense system